MATLQSNPNTHVQHEDSTALPSTELQQVRTEAYQDFLDTDLSIKELLLEPPALRDDFLAARRLLDRHMTLVAGQFDSLASSLEIQNGVADSIPQAIENQAEYIRQRFIHSIDGVTSVSDIQQIYHDCASEMSVDFVDDVVYHMTAYTGLENGKAFVEMAERAKSFNELLYLAHSFAGQNEQIHQGLSRWDQHKIDPENSPLQREIVAVGAKTQLGQSVFESLKDAFDEIDSDIITVFATEDQVQVMVRDYGHALTMILEQSPDFPPHVKYRIPKTFGPENVEHVRGLESHNDRHNIGRGFFRLDEGEEMGPALVDFILSIPTDSDPYPMGNRPLVHGE